MAKKILIFGATGSVGSSLAKLVKDSSMDAHLIGKNVKEIYPGRPILGRYRK